MKFFGPDLVTILITDEPVAQLGRKTVGRNLKLLHASWEIFCTGPPTTSSLSSAPSTVTLPPRPSGPLKRSPPCWSWSDRSSGRVSCRDQQCQFKKVAAIQRQAFNLAPRNPDQPLRMNSNRSKVQPLEDWSM